MNKLHLSFFVLFFLSPFPGLADDQQSVAELGLSQAPLARQGDIVLTQAEIDAAFSKIPPEFRLPFIRNGEKVETLVRNLLKNKVLAEEARKAGYDQEILVKLRLGLAVESELAAEWLDEIVAAAPGADYEVLAYEHYLLDPEAWKRPDQIDVSHILISSESRSPDAALELANSLYEQLVLDPSLYDSMVAEYSEDPSKTANGGRFPRVNRGDMVEPFEEAAFALSSPGEISAPVETIYGFHIIRVNEYFPAVVLPFEEIKTQATEQARKQYLDEYRKNYLRATLSNPIVLPDGAAEEMAKRYFGENLELAPEFND
jgi:peptidyl-prolyl cis-trans isomerase C